jgi:rod shape-determining protein MreD
VFNVRERLQRDETVVRVTVALLVNLALFFVLSLMRVRPAGLGAAAWPRLLSDLAWSETALLVAAPWFFALQLRTLELARANPTRLA